MSRLPWVCTRDSVASGTQEPPRYAVASQMPGALDCTVCRQSGVIARARGGAGKEFRNAPARTQEGPSDAWYAPAQGSDIATSKYLPSMWIHVVIHSALHRSMAVLALHATHDSHTVRRQSLSRRPDSILSVARHWPHNDFGMGLGARRRVSRAFWLRWAPVVGCTNLISCDAVFRLL